ncbi:helix-turn-helix domain-containing protein [Pseudomonas sp. 18175]|uniref:helix-turn-helix domain-containing protein n=1 Tax=Pseudomonas sp. 18175 TaxID=3390056 RepID=UPI003D1DFD0E
MTAISNSMGVARNTIYNWMAKGNVPLNSLVGLAGMLGMDAVYVLTGKHMTDALNAEEAKLLDGFRSAPKSVQNAVSGALAAGRENAKVKKVKQIFNGPVGQSVDGDITNHQPVTFNLGDTPKE